MRPVSHTQARGREAVLAIAKEPLPSGAVPAEGSRESTVSLAPGRPVQNSNAGPLLSTPLPPTPPHSTLPPCLPLPVSPGGAGGRAWRDHPAGPGPPEPRHCRPCRPCLSSLGRSLAPCFRCCSLCARPLPRAFSLPNSSSLLGKRTQRSSWEAAEREKI